MSLQQNIACSSFERDIPLGELAHSRPTPTSEGDRPLGEWLGATKQFCIKLGSGAKAITSSARVPWKRHRSQKEMSLWLRYFLWSCFYLLICYLQPRQPCNLNKTPRSQALLRSYRPRQQLLVSVRPGHILSSCDHFCSSFGSCEPMTLKPRRLRWLERFCGEERVALTSLRLRFRAAEAFTLYCPAEANSLQSLMMSPIWLDTHVVKIRNETMDPSRLDASSTFASAYSAWSPDPISRSTMADWQLLVYHAPDPLSRDASRYMITRAEWIASGKTRKSHMLLPSTGGVAMKALQLSVTFLADASDRNYDIFLAHAEKEKQTVHLWPARKTRLDASAPENLQFWPSFRSKGELFSLWMLVFGMALFIASFRHRGTRLEHNRPSNGPNRRLGASPQLSGTLASHRGDVVHSQLDCESGKSENFQASHASVQTASDTHCNGNRVEVSGGTVLLNARGLDDCNTADGPNLDPRESAGKMTVQVFFGIFYITQTSAMGLLSFIGIFCPPTSCVKLVAVDIVTATAAAFLAGALAQIHEHGWSVALTHGVDEAVEYATDVGSETNPFSHHTGKNSIRSNGAHLCQSDVLAQPAENVSCTCALSRSHEDRSTSFDMGHGKFRAKLTRCLWAFESPRLFSSLPASSWKRWLAALLHGMLHRKSSCLPPFMDLRLKRRWLLRGMVFYIVPRLILSVGFWGKDSSRIRAMLLNLQTLVPISVSALFGAELANRIKHLPIPSILWRYRFSLSLSVPYPLRLLQFWLVLDMFRTGWFYPAAGKPLPFSIFFRLPSQCSGDFVDNLSPEAVDSVKKSLLAYYLLPWHGWKVLYTLFVSLILVMEF